MATSDKWLFETLGLRIDPLVTAPSLARAASRAPVRSSGFPKGQSDHGPSGRTDQAGKGPLREPKAAHTISAMQFGEHMLRVFLDRTLAGFGSKALTGLG